MSSHATTTSHWIWGTRVRVRTVGTGDPLLLVMGIGGHMDMWEPLEDLLGSRQLVMFDFPGTGHSGLPMFPPTIPHSALFVRLLAGRVGLRRPDVLGYSWGGLVAQQLAVQHPHTVRRLVLACTSYGLGSAPSHLRAALTMATPARYYSNKYFRRTAGVTFGGRFRTDSHLAEEEARRRMERPPSLIGYSWQLAASATYSSLPLLPRVSAETLVLAGTDDPIVPPVNQRVLGRLIPKSRVELVPDAGHLLLQEHPQAVARLIDNFLQGGLQAAVSAAD